MIKQTQLQLKDFETDRCDNCGIKTDFLVDYYKLLCQKCKNELFPIGNKPTMKFNIQSQGGTLENGLRN